MKRTSRTPALPRALLVLVLGLSQVAFNARIVVAASENFLDHFDTISYGNDDGTLPWEGPWSEIGEVTDPETGDWTITTDFGFPGQAVKATKHDGKGLLRTADLEGFTSATLHFRFRREKLVHPKSMAVQVSSSGPAGPWTTVHTISGAIPEATDPLYQDVSVDITGHISSSTTVRIIHEEGAGSFGANMAVYIDDVEITVEQTNRAPVLDGVGLLVVDEGSELGFVASATDPDGDGVVFVLEGDVPAGAAITPDGVFSWIPDESQGPGTYLFDLVATDSGSPVLTDTETVQVTVTEVNQAPVVTDPDDQLDGEGSTVSLALQATDPDLPTNELTWAGSGLPPGLAMDAGGVITGTVDPLAAADSPYVVTADVTDQHGATNQTTFTWTISELPSVSPPVHDPPAQSDPIADDNPGDETDGNSASVERTSADAMSTLGTPGSGNLVEPALLPLPAEGPHTQVESVNLTSSSEQGRAPTVGGVLKAIGLAIPTAFERDDLQQPTLFRAVSLFTKAFFHTILAMDIPTLLLGFAAITLVGLRGVSRYPVLLNRRSRHYWAVVMLGRERRLGVHERAKADSTVIYKLGPTAQSVSGTGFETSADGSSWVGVKTPTGEGWVERSKVTEQVDVRSFVNDVRPRKLLEEFLGRLRSNRDVSDLVSERGLILVLAEMTQNLDKDVLATLVSDPADTRVSGSGWSPRDFHNEVVQPLLEAFDEKPVISPHVAHAETSLLPTPMRNFRYLALGGPGALSWLVFFEYSEGKPRIVGLTIDQ